uniref:Uncharacterized protein n=1 Tax=Panagrolaimus superbus TaxID=310955 RepID=A0A914ZC86_9BILA
MMFSHHFEFSHRKDAIGFLSKNDKNTLDFLVVDSVEEKRVVGNVYSNLKEFMDEIPKCANCFKFFIVNLFGLPSDTVTGETPYSFCKELKKKFKELKIPSYFISTENCLFSTLLIAASVDVKVDEKIFLILPHGPWNDNQSDTFGLSVGEFKFTLNGFQQLRFETLPSLNFKENPEILCEQICGTKTPRKVYSASFGPKKNPLKKIFKPNSLTLLNCCIRCHLDRYLLQTCKWFFDKTLIKYHVIPTVAKGIHIYANYGSEENILEILKINICDSLPLSKTAVFTKSFPQIMISLEDDVFKKYVVPKTLTKDCHRYQVTVTIDEENMDMIKFEKLEINNFNDLLLTADKMMKAKIPLIGFFYNSSIIGIYESSKESYEFMEEWNGCYGIDCFISFDQKRPKFGEKALEALQTKNTCVDFDLLKILSMPPEEIKIETSWGFTFTNNDENPILLEFDTFKGTQMASSPTFLMAMFLRQHLKAIEAKIGEKTKKIGLWIFEDLFDETQMARIKNGLEEACKLIKIDCIFIDNENFVADFIVSDITEFNI